MYICMHACYGFCHLDATMNLVPKAESCMSFQPCPDTEPAGSDIYEDAQEHMWRHSFHFPFSEESGWRMKWSSVSLSFLSLGQLQPKAPTWEQKNPSIGWLFPWQCDFQKGESILEYSGQRKALETSREYWEGWCIVFIPSTLLEKRKEEKRMIS